MTDTSPYGKKSKPTSTNLDLTKVDSEVHAQHAEVPATFCEQLCKAVRNALGSLSEEEQAELLGDVWLSETAQRDLQKRAPPSGGYSSGQLAYLRKRWSWIKQRRYAEAWRSREVELDARIAEGLEDVRSENSAETAALQRAVTNAMSKLQKADREVLSLRHFKKWDFGRIAKLQGISTSGARSRYSRALKKLRAVLMQSPGPIVIPVS